MQAIMLLDSDVLWRAQMARSLGRLPAVDILEAASVAESLALLEHFEIDLVVGEIVLSDGSISSLLPRLRTARIPLLAVSRWLGTHGQELPDSVPRLAAPVATADLEVAVSRQLGRAADLGPPCALTDCLQIACYGRRSLQLEVLQGGEISGFIQIREGEPWRAVDSQGQGADALSRMLALRKIGLVCGPLSPLREPRNLSGNVEFLLLEAARTLDEKGQEPLATDVAAAPAESPVAGLSPNDDAAPQAVVFSEGSTQISSPEFFAQLYDQGIEHLLAKRLPDAFHAFLQARRHGTNPTLEANLTRLRELGFS